MAAALIPNFHQFSCPSVHSGKMLNPTFTPNVLLTCKWIELKVPVGRNELTVEGLCFFFRKWHPFLWPVRREPFRIGSSNLPVIVHHHVVISPCMCENTDPYSYISCWRYSHRDVPLQRKSQKNISFSDTNPQRRHNCTINPHLLIWCTFLFPVNHLSLSPLSVFLHFFFFFCPLALIIYIVVKQRR